MDATCYESYVRFPTDVKLLWESCHWIFEKQLYRWCKILGVKRPRSKYVNQKRLQLIMIAGARNLSNLPSNEKGINLSVGKRDRSTPVSIRCSSSNRVKVILTEHIFVRSEKYWNSNSFCSLIKLKN